MDCLTKPAPWGSDDKPRRAAPARILSVRPSLPGAPGSAGQPATHIIVVETADAVLDLHLDRRSAALLLAIARYLSPAATEGLPPNPAGC
jgi:predicted deacylase